MIEKSLSIANIFVKKHYIEDKDFFAEDGLGNFLLNMTKARHLNYKRKWVKIAEFLIEKYPKEACKELVTSLVYWTEL